MEQMQEEKINLEEVIPVGTIISVARDVLRRWYIIAAAALIMAMAAYIYADVSYVPQYSTTTTFVVTSGSTFATTYQNLTATTETAGLFTEIINSSLLRKKVTEQTGITGFDGTISAVAVPETNLLNMTVSGSDPRTVFLVTRAVIDNHTVVSSEVLGDTVLQVLREPVIPGGPSNIKGTSRLMKLALTAGAAATAAYLAARDWMADKVRSRTEADRKLRCRMLGELYHERKHRKLADYLRRKKTGILISNPLTSFIYAEAIHKLSGRIDKLRRKGERVVMISSFLENEGKSTVAVNLALSWAAKGRNVLLLDCDLRKPSCHRILEMPESNGMVRLLRGEAQLDELAVQVPGSTLKTVCGGRAIRNASTLLTSPYTKKVLREAAAKYDLVIVDTPPMGLTPDAECISEFVHCAVLVARQNAAAAEDLNRAVQILEKSEVHMLGCVLNNVYGAGYFAPAFHSGVYGYGKYGKYGRYGKYGKYGYGKYGRYGYGRYGYGYGHHQPESPAPEGKEKGEV